MQSCLSKLPLAILKHRCSGELGGGPTHCAIASAIFRAAAPMQDWVAATNSPNQVTEGENPIAHGLQQISWHQSAFGLAIMCVALP